MRWWLAFIGLAVELLGLVMAARGLAKSWSANAQPDSDRFWPPHWYRRVARRWRRRKAVLDVRAGGASASVTVPVVSGGYRGDPQASLEDRLEAAERRLSELGADARRTGTQVARLEASLNEAVKSLQQRVARAKTDVLAHVSRGALEDLRMAAWGLVWAIGGLGLQMAAVVHL